jgi:hypothetical protein
MFAFLRGNRRWPDASERVFFNLFVMLIPFSCKRAGEKTDRPAGVMDTACEV